MNGIREIINVYQYVLVCYVKVLQLEWVTGQQVLNPYHLSPWQQLSPKGMALSPSPKATLLGPNGGAHLESVLPYQCV